MAFAATPLKNVTLFDSKARTADENSASQNNYAYRGVQVMVNISAVTGSGAGTFTIQGYDELSGEWFTVLASASKTATGFFTLTAYPGITASSNVSASTVLPKTWRLAWDLTAGTGQTFSASATLLP
jgi:hypothetical protein